MRLDEAIRKYLSLPLAQQGMDERAFFNVLLDLHAFDDTPSLKFILLAFIEHGFLKDLLGGSQSWKLKAKYYLTNLRGFEEKHVADALSQLDKGFDGYSISTAYNRQKKSSNIEHHNFKKYEVEELVDFHPSKPLDFSMQPGDIVLANNGVAVLTVVERDYVIIQYLKKNMQEPRRKVFYDEKLDFILSPVDDRYYVSSKGRHLYVKTIDMDDTVVRIHGIYSDSTSPITLIPYTFYKQGFKESSETDFINHCSDTENFYQFRAIK